MKIILLLVLLVAFTTARQHDGFGSSKSTSQNRIVGGAPLNIADYGWQVSLQFFGSHFCGGSIINEHWILSAGHCFGSNTFPFFTSIRVGSNYTKKGGEVRHVNKIIVHPGFNKNTLDNDASLVHVWPPIDLNDETVRIANVVQEGVETPSGTLVTVTGWGALKQGGTVSSQLEGVTIPIISREDCEATNSQLGGLTNTMMCAGVPEGGKDSCQGDSGGPLVTEDKTLVGIVSWGIGCAQPNSPGVYTEIASPSIRDFIRQHTGV